MTKSELATAILLLYGLLLFLQTIAPKAAGPATQAWNRLLGLCFTVIVTIIGLAILAVLLANGG